MGRTLAALVVLTLALLRPGAVVVAQPALADVRLVGEGVDPGVLATDSAVLSAWLTREVGRHWALPAYSLVVHVLPLPLAACDDQSTGCHQVEGGLPVGYVGLDPVDGTGNLLLIASHELVEMVSNPYLDRFAPGLLGDYFEEAADPVEGVEVPFDFGGRRYWLSDYVFPGFFTGEDWPYDAAGEVPCGLCAVVGGYENVRRGGDWQSVPGLYPPALCRMGHSCGDGP